MSKHKEVRRWACGFEPWDDVLVVSCATLIETNKTWRLRGSNPHDRVRPGPAERMFSQHVGYRERWDKEAYPSVGWATQNGAIRGFLQHLDEEVEKAEKALEARKRLREYARNQVYNKTYRKVVTDG